MSVLTYIYCPIFACLSASQLNTMLWSMSVWNLLYYMSYHSIK